MIDLTAIETLLNHSKTFRKVHGVLDVRQAIEKGINNQSEAFVMPLNTRSDKSSSGTFTEYKNTHRFAVVVGMRQQKQGAGSNKDFAALVHKAIQALAGKSVSGIEGLIELGSGALLPIRNNSCVFWQQEFSIIHYLEAH